MTSRAPPRSPRRRAIGASARGLERRRPARAAASPPPREGGSRVPLAGERLSPHSAPLTHGARMESWSIDIYKEYFKFSAAHFLIFPDGSAERLHGHNYRVYVEIAAELS